MRQRESARSRIIQRSPAIVIGLVIGMVGSDLLRGWLGLPPPASPFLLIASWVVGAVAAWLALAAIDAYRRGKSPRDASPHR